MISCDDRLITTSSGTYDRSRAVNSSMFCRDALPRRPQQRIWSESYGGPKTTRRRRTRRSIGW